MNKINVNENISAALNILCNCTNAYNDINMVIAYHDRVVSSEIAERSRACYDFLVTRYEVETGDLSSNDLLYTSIAVNKQQLYRLLIEKTYDLCSRYRVENELKRILISLRVLMI